jgi:hypothetical protein
MCLKKVSAQAVVIISAVPLFISQKLQLLGINKIIPVSINLFKGTWMDIVLWKNSTMELGCALGLYCGGFYFCNGRRNGLWNFDGNYGIEIKIMAIKLSIMNKQVA